LSERWYFRLPVKGVISRAKGQAQLWALKQQNGQEVWQVEAGQLANVAPVLAGADLYVRTVDGQVLAYEAVETDR